MALVAMRDRLPWRVFALLSDGECDEGSTWEPILFAPHHRLNNLVAIVDYNKLQSLGKVADTLNLEPFADKWKAFGWAVQEVDGHDMAQLLSVFKSLPFTTDKPSCIISHSIKGKGVSFMENAVLWHYRPPDKTELERALAEVEKGI